MREIDETVADVLEGGNLGEYLCGMAIGGGYWAGVVVGGVLGGLAGGYIAYTQAC